MPPAAPVRYPDAGLLRLISVVLVLFSHALVIADGDESRDPFRQLLGAGSTVGLYGVFALFVLSGFLLTRCLLQRPTPWRFAVRRAGRMLPAVLLSVLLVVLVVGGALTSLTFPDYLNRVATWSYALRTVALLDTSDEGLPGVQFSDNDFGAIVNGSVWTLGPLALFALGLGLLAVARLLRWWCLAVVLVVGLWAHQYAAAPLADARYLLPFFAAGALGAALQDRVRRPWLVVAVCVAGLAAGVALERPTSAFAVFGSALVLLAATARARPAAGALSAVPVSYLAYLLGWPALQVVRSLGGGSAPWGVVFLVGTAAAFGTAALLQRTLTVGAARCPEGADDGTASPVRFGQALLRVGAVCLLVLALGGAVALARGLELGRPRVLVVGGSSIAGATDVTSALGRRSRLVIVDGGGFARSDRRGGRTVTAAVRTLPELAAYDRIVLQGGEADHAAPPKEVCIALLHLADYVQAEAPEASIVVVGPIPAVTTPPPSIRQVNEALRSCAEFERLEFVDALESEWIDSDPGLGQKLAGAVV